MSDRGPSISLQSTLACPDCGHQATETMPTDACQFFYDCKGCGVVLKPLAGDCCVFCSYGTVPCPPIQEARAGGGDAACCS
ncbi:MAG TPA: GDCCVxC domain-containing (seleno)protein [Alphaproteobacteria bacterium]|nr:GDCCVxC domain-containing (seleno)protein [Alphaproteobacteria bacterium]